MKKIIYTLILLMVGIISYSQTTPGGITVTTNFQPNIAAPIDARLFLSALADTSTVAFPASYQLVYVEDVAEYWRYNTILSKWETVVISSDALLADTSTIRVYAPAHGYTLASYTGEVIAVKDSYVTANATNIDSTQRFYVVNVPHVDSLDLKQSGEITRTAHGLTLASTYYLQDTPNSTYGLTQGTVRAPTFFVLDDNTLLLLEQGVNSTTVIPRRVIPSSVITSFGGDPFTPHDTIIQNIAEVFSGNNLIVAPSILVTQTSGSSRNDTHVAATSDPSTPMQVWFWDGALVTRISYGKIAVSAQDTVYGTLGNLPLDTALLVAGVPNDSTIADWLETNFTTNGLSLRNGDIVYWPGSGSKTNPDYMWIVTDDLNVTGIGGNDYDKILKRVKEPSSGNSNGSNESAYFLDTITVATGGGLLKPVYLAESDEKWRLADNTEDSTLAHAIIVDSINTTTFAIQNIGLVTIPSHGYAVGENYSLGTSGTNVLSTSLSTGYDQWIFVVRDENRLDLRVTNLVLTESDLVSASQLNDSLTAIRNDLSVTGDSLWNHVALENIDLDTFWLSPDGTSKGLQFPSSGGYIYESLVNATYREQTTMSSTNLTTGIVDDSFLGSQISFFKDATDPRIDFNFNVTSYWRFFKDHLGIIPATSDPVDATFGEDYLYLWPLRSGAAGTGVLQYKDGITGITKTIATVDQTGNAFGVQVSIEGGLTEALAAVTATRKTILVDEVVTLSSNTTIPDSVDLQFVDGGFINLDNDTLFLHGGMNASRRQIFDASSGGVITGNTFTTTWFSEWFGAIPDDGLYDSEAFDYTGKTIRNIGGGTFELLSGTYNIDTAASVYSNTLLKGQGIGVTIIEAPTDTLEVRYQLRGAQRRLYAFLIGEYGGSDVENVTAQDITFLMHDTDIGNAADENNSWDTNWSTQPIGAHLWRNSNGTSTGKVDKLLFQRLEVRNYNAWQPVVRDAGNEIPGVTIGVEYNTDVTIQDCILDSTANKAIEFQEISGGFVRGNTIRNAASGIQLINFCDRVQVYDNYVEFENGGIITASEISDCEIRDNYIKYTGSATSTNVDPFLACVGLKQEEEQEVFTTSGLRVEGNTFDCTLNTQDSFYSVTIFTSADTAIFEDIQFIGNKHIRGKVGLYNQRHSDGDFITKVRNVSFFNENNISLVSDYDPKDTVYDISFRNNHFREEIDTTIIRGKEWSFINNDMRKLRFEFAAESDTANVFAYNIVNDTSNIIAAAENYYQFNIIPKIEFEIDTTPPAAVSWIAEWAGDLGVTTAADVGNSIDTLVSWADQTGNGHTLVPIPESGTRGAIYNAGTLNGHRYITFSPTAGKTKVLETIDSITYGDSWSIFMLARPNQAVIYPIELETDNSSVTNLRIYDSTRSEDIGGVIKGVNVDKTNVGGTDDWAFYNWNRASNLVTLTFNNNTFSTQDITSTASEDITKTNIGGRWWPPTREETDAFDLIHVIIFDRSATPAERDAIKSAWETKYGLTF